MHGHTRIDEYYWLNQSENPEVIAYLQAENAYTDAVSKPAAGLRETLYREMAGRVQQTDVSVPYFENGYWYYTRFEKGKDYPVYCRRKRTMSGAEQVLLDGNRMAAGEKYFNIGRSPSAPTTPPWPTAWTRSARRQYRIRFRSLKTGKEYAEEIKMTAGRPGLGRGQPHPLLHGDRPRDPALLPRSCATSWRPRPPAIPPSTRKRTKRSRCASACSRSRRYLILASRSTLSDEYRILDAARPEEEFVVFQERVRGLEYSIDHLGGRFYVLTNDGAVNFKLMEAGPGSTGRESGPSSSPTAPMSSCEDFELFDGHLVLSERRAGLTRIRVLPWGDPKGYTIDFPEQAYMAYPAFTAEPASDRMRFNYTSLITPASVYEFNMKTRERTLLKRQEVLGGYDPGAVRDREAHGPGLRRHPGARSPWSTARTRPGAPGTPLLLYGYGSYGYSTDPTFSPVRLSLLDRGFVYAIAHVRGGQELGAPGTTTASCSRR